MPPFDTKRTIAEFLRLKQRILARRQEVQSELKELDQIFEEGSTPAASPPESLGFRSQKARVIELLERGPMSLDEIHDALQRSGYRFKSANPKNSLRVLLYSSKPRFRRIGKKFCLPNRA